jgi:hypothetical protein
MTMRACKSAHLMVATRAKPEKILQHFPSAMKYTGQYALTIVVLPVGG